MINTDWKKRAVEHKRVGVQVNSPGLRIQYKCSQHDMIYFKV